MQFACDACMKACMHAYTCQCTSRPFMVVVRIMVHAWCTHASCLHAIMTACWQETGRDVLQHLASIPCHLAHNHRALFARPVVSFVSGALMRIMKVRSERSDLNACPYCGGARPNSTQLVDQSCKKGHARMLFPRL